MLGKVGGSRYGERLPALFLNGAFYDAMTPFTGENSEWISAIVDDAMDAIISIDENYNVVIFNKAAEVTFKLKAEDAKGQPLDRFIPERFRAIHREHVATFLETAKTSRQVHSPRVLYGLRNNGEEFPMEATISHGVVGGRKLMTVILRDITQRRQSEREITHLQKMEALGRLAGGIAHDFNNLLMVIRGNVDMTLSGGLGPAHVKQNLQSVLEAVERGTGLISQLMLFARQRTSRELESVSVGELFTSIEKMVPRLIGDNVTFAIKWNIVAPIIGDKHQLFQALLNLIINAKDAMPKGGSITLGADMVVLDEHYSKLHPHVKLGSYVLISVQDTGVGMTDAVRDRMFDPFFTTKAEGKGTGLGLSMVAGVVQDCGGHIETYTEVAQGTVVKLFFPAHGPVKAPMANDAMIHGAVLVVEDEVALRSIICEVLVERGFSVLEATNGEDAINVAKRHHDKIAIVISDLVMPAMGGVEMTKRLKKIIPDFALILMSGYNEVGPEVDALLNDDKSAMMHKPFAMQDMLTVISNLTMKNRGGRG
jgi:PAS domain S-box-containing protein